MKGKTIWIEMVCQDVTKDCMTQINGIVITALEKSNYHFLLDLTNMIEEGKNIIIKLFSWDDK